MISYFKRHWSGDHSLTISILVNLVAGYVVLTTFFVLTGRMISSQTYFGLGMTVFLIWIIWALVGVFRCTVKQLMDQGLQR